MPTKVKRPRQFRLGDASLDAKRQLELQQIHLPPRPKSDVPDLPEDPTELDDGPLMRLFTQMTRWADYLEAQLACAEVDERWSESHVERLRAVAALRSDAKSVTAQKAAAHDDPEFNEARERFQDAHAYRKLVEVVARAVDRDSKLLSRELTRRVGRDPQERRADRWVT